MECVIKAPTVFIHTTGHCLIGALYLASIFHKARVLMVMIAVLAMDSHFQLIQQIKLNKREKLNIRPRK